MTTTMVSEIDPALAHGEVTLASGRTGWFVDGVFTGYVDDMAEAWPTTRDDEEAEVLLAEARFEAWLARCEFD